MMKSVYAIGTLDTKGREVAYVAGLIREAGLAVTLVDVGTAQSPQVPPDIPRKAVAARHPDGTSAVLGLTDRGTAVTAMSEALRNFMADEERGGRVLGVIGLGGTGGTALISPALRTLSIGLPKVLVSTVASGNTQPYVGTSDLVLVNSVVDVAGLNRVSRRVLGNAAHAIVGMVARSVPLDAATRRTAGMTMFGVTTPCVNAVRGTLEAAGWDCLVFHATGAGGQAMEKLAGSGLMEGLLDLTTTEVADEVVGGVFRAGPDRFKFLADRNVPCVLSLGALDMVNFGSPDTVPARFKGRNLHVHNAQVTLMRTTPEENRLFARWMVPKLNQARGNLRLLIPENGLSKLDAPGQPFHDPEADAALFEEIEKLWNPRPNHGLIRLPFHINDREFAETAVEEFQKIL